jgi:hypothetical protein
MVGWFRKPSKKLIHYEDYECQAHLKKRNQIPIKRGPSMGIE